MLEEQTFKQIACVNKNYRSDDARRCKKRGTCFIEDLTIHDFHPVSASLCFCKFNSDSYSDKLFSEYRIPLPGHIYRAVKKRRAEYLAGRYCAKKALKELNIDQLPQHTKLSRAPAWPPNTAGSISHSDSLAVAIVSTADLKLGIGIDVEPVIDETTAQSIKHLIIDETELNLLKSYPDLQHNLLLTLFFSIKESFFKSVYQKVNHFFDFHAVRITSLGANSNRIAFELKKSLTPNLQIGDRFIGEYSILSFMEDTVVATTFSG